MEQGSAGSRERILKVAERVFAAQGFDRARVEEIARLAGVNKALIYYYFKSKADMLDQLVEQIIEEGKSLQKTVLAEILGNQEQAPPPLEEGVFKKVLDKTLEFLEQRKDVLNIVFMQALKSHDKRNPLFRYLDSSIQKPLRNLAGQEGKVPRDETALSLQNLYMGFVPLLCFVLLNDKWCKYYGIEEKQARAYFLDRFYHEYYIDTFTRMFV
jgi:AcrR family transcriptional regulator